MTVVMDMEGRLTWTGTSDHDPVVSRLRPIPSWLAEERAHCPRCRRSAVAVGRIGRRLVFAHCGVHYFRK